MFLQISASELTEEKLVDKDIHPSMCKEQVNLF